MEGVCTSDFVALFDSSSIIEETYSEFASTSSFRETIVKSAPLDKLLNWIAISSSSLWFVSKYIISPRERVAVCGWDFTVITIFSSS